MTGEPLNPGFFLEIPKMRQNLAETTDSRVFEILQPAVDVNHAVRVNPQSSYDLQSSTVMLHRSFAATANLHSLSLVPEYSIGDPVGHAGNYGTRTGMKCMLATSRHGYLYDAQDPRLLATFMFTDDTITARAKYDHRSITTFQHLIVDRGCARLHVVE